MNTANFYMKSLFSMGIIILLYALTQLHTQKFTIFIIMLLIITILEVFPVNLPSGDEYSAGSIGFLFLLIYFGFAYASIAIALGLLAYGIKRSGTFKVPIFKLFVNIGMYTFSMLAAYVVWKLTSSWNLLLAVGLTGFVYEFVNIILLDGIMKSVAGREMFTNFKQKLAELIVPIFVYVIVTPKLYSSKSTFELFDNVIYTLLFLLVIIFFSREYTKQLSLRHSSSKAFIQLLEGRIAPAIAGHGNRVGVICEVLLDDFGYPKRKRPDLIQAAIIHDIGKALLPEAIFRKRGDFTLSEEMEFRTHPEKAVEIVKTMFPKERFSDWVLYHHERWDGKGFPKGLKKEEIPLESRIISLGTTVDKLMLRHTDPETILKLLKEMAGNRLDPRLVDKIEINHIRMIQAMNQYAAADVEAAPAAALEASQKDILKEDTYSSIGESYFIHFKNGKWESEKKDFPKDFAMELVQSAFDQRKPVHEICQYQDRVLDLHVTSNGVQSAVVFVHDITSHLGYRSRLEEKILESYMDVVRVLSDGKIILYSSKKELEEKLGELQDELAISSNTDVPKSRALIKGVLEARGTEMKSMKVQIAVSEVVTNILKHAAGGRFAVYENEDKLQVFVSDKGSGIPLHEIPKTILVSGYSSKRSLGQGFKMIASYSDQVHMYTSSEGTAILLEYSFSKTLEDSSDAS
ncbi:HD domain-containing phosphohydrolase [Falsibacillus pallidus]|uniref:Histidine kinase-like protein n=1 Tax=Falsibacillus pallidus TaxID=493781 RepID=A0A370G8B3_9BACI|nr:HD domain-containing phosphohydrolase [Falsibacillus pallidus]RDI40042.1 histidine kinase-like protein [Falsibacillus pallidus]